MSTMVGADAAELERLAKRFDTAADALDTLGRAMGASVRIAPWLGAVADAFKVRWTSMHARHLAECAAFLRDSAGDLRANAEDQRSASRGAGGFEGSSSVPFSGPVRPLVDGLPDGKDPAAVAEYWNSLSPEQQRALIERAPDAIGNLDGIPPEARFEANHLRIERDLQQMIDSGHTHGKRYEMLKYLSESRSVDAAGRATTEPLQVYIYDPAGDGRVAVVDGDLANAKNVGVVVPGTGADLNGAKGTLADGRRLFLESGPNTAIVTWIGYDAPDAVLPTQNGQPVALWANDNAMLEKFADRGSKQLALSLEGLGVPREANLTVIGHSYGSYVAVRGADAYGQVDNIVVIGSPGSGFQHASQVDIDGKFYAMATPGDPVAHLNIFGTPPTDPMFGATVLSTEVPGYSVQSGHSGYFHQDSATQVNSASLQNMANVVSGGGGLRVHRADISDYVESGVRLNNLPLDLANHQVDFIQDHVPLPQLLDDTLDNGQGAVKAAGSAVAGGAGYLAETAYNSGAKAVGFVGDRISDAGSGISNYWRKHF